LTAENAKLLDKDRREICISDKRLAETTRDSISKRNRSCRHVQRAFP